MAAPATEAGDEGMWVPEEYLGHEAAARELESEAAGAGAGVSHVLQLSCWRLMHVRNTSWTD